MSSVLLVRHGTSHSDIELITDNRGQQSFEAVYILMPTTENVRRIIRDFGPGREKYPGAHIFFTDRMQPWCPLHLPETDASALTAIPDQLLLELGDGPHEKYLNGVKDLYLNFWRESTLSFVCVLF